MKGIAKNIIVISIREGTTFKNFDFIFCDFIKHPNASIISDNTIPATSIITIILKLAKKMEDTILLKLFIYSSSIIKSFQVVLLVYLFIIERL